MQEIEFRAWLWKHLKVVDVKRIDFEAQEITYEEIDFEYEDVIREKTALFKDISLLRYVGLKDKNGVKIFEGDIVKVGNEGNALVYYNEEKAGFGIKYSNDCCYSIYESCYHMLKKIYICEVIGNIYTNKELLEDV